MKKILFSMIVALFFVSGALAISESENSSYWITQNNCGEKSNSVDKVNINNNAWLNNIYLSAGFHRIKVTGTEDSCHPNQIVWGEYDLHKGDSGMTCLNVKRIKSDECGEYIITIDGKNYTYFVNNPDYPIYPVVPEFGFLIGSLTVLGALIALFVIRKK